MLSSNYKEIGFAIKKGRLLGEDTTLVVEMFGNTDIVPLANTPGQSSPQIQANVLPAAIDTHGQEELPGIVNGYMLKTTSLLSSRAVTSSIGFIILITFIGILIVDLVVIERKSIVRVVGHNIDHIFFLSAIFVIMIVILRGVVL
jgi:hypothetical protein